MPSLQTHDGLDWLIESLSVCGDRLDAATIKRLLSRVQLSDQQIRSYIGGDSSHSSRRCVSRNQQYEIALLTWAPGQSSVAHDHLGCTCGLKILRGHAEERTFCLGPDGQVRAKSCKKLTEGGVSVDSAGTIHSIRNDSASELLISLHLYTPPLPEIRRHAITEVPPAQVFVRERSSDAKVIAVIGGGFSGSMVLANLLRFANPSPEPLHAVLIDRQPALGEGIAYRTNDPQHLLNVPADRMSAWPDPPGDFLEFARSRDASIQGGDFLPRRMYGQYIRETVLREAASAGLHLSVAVHRDEATSVTSDKAGGWKIHTARGQFIRADAAVIAVGHRPPNDPFGDRWVGSRHRLIADPWSSLALNQIEGHELVVIIGSGLTAVDALLTLISRKRTAPIIVVSRRGLLPQAHSPSMLPPEDLSQLVADWLNPANPLTVRRMTSDLRQRIRLAERHGTDWRQVIDGLRPFISSLWARLDLTERFRFLSHVRPFWEIHRHRTAPPVAARIRQLCSDQLLCVTAGSVVSAKAEAEHIDVSVSLRGKPEYQEHRAAWVINCTGPGVQGRHSTHPLLRPLLKAGVVVDDEMSLGVMTDDVGRVIDAKGCVVDSLLVTGTLRKSTLWESTAVPELRQQAQVVARTALSMLRSRAIGD